MVDHKCFTESKEEGFIEKLVLGFIFVVIVFFGSVVIFYFGTADLIWKEGKAKSYVAPINWEGSK